MTKRLIRSILLLVLAVLLLVFGVFAAITYPLRLPLGQLILPFVISILVGLVIALVLAIWLTKVVIRPIREWELNHPEFLKQYPEFAPLVTKLQTQTRTIRDQTLDLFRKQEEFRTISENMTEGLLVVDRNGTVLSYNTAAIRLLDVQPEENQNVLAFANSKRFRKAVDEALQGNHSLQHMNLWERTYQIIANPVTQEDELIGGVIMILDVTEREERDRLRKEFSANVSHELKTPLTTISGFAEIMMHGVAKAEDMQQFAGKIYHEAQRLIAMIGDIIQLSRLDERDLLEQMQSVELLGLADRIAKRFQVTAAERQVSLRVQGQVCQVEGVPQILEEMVANLCDNAIKYNRPGGSVTVAVIPREQDILLSVNDTGIGIGYDDQQRVFERFFRGDKSHSPQIGGTGLGLSIVKHAAAFHNATISLDSVPGEGTTVSVEFQKAK